MKKFLKSKISYVQKICFGYYQKYFSEVGYVTREFNYFLNLIYFKKEIKIRKNIFFKPLPCNSRIVDSLRKEGFVKLNLADLGINHSLQDYCLKIAKKYESHTFDDVKKIRGNAGKYYWINCYEPNLDCDDPVIELTKNLQVLSIASEYLGSCPYVQELNLYYSPPQDLNLKQLVGSQQWHLDNDKKRRLKIFYSPRSISSVNGPTTVLSKKITSKSKYPNYPGYFSDIEATSVGLDLRNSIEFTASPEEIYIADTSQCFHFGSRNNTSPRLMLILGLGTIESYLNLWQVKRELADQYGFTDLNKEITKIAMTESNIEKVM